MDEMEVNLLLKYPFISRNVGENAVVYEGSVVVKDEDYRISITECGNLLKVLLPTPLVLFETKLNTVVNNLHPKNILTTLDNICLYLATHVPSNAPVDYSDIYRHVLLEYSEFTNFYFNLTSCRLQHDLSKITISMKDARQRSHSVEVSVAFNDKKNLFQIASYDLPQDIESFKGSASLKAVYEQFLKAVEALQPFFDLLDTFDKYCWIMDPLQPTRSCHYRRISIGENLSVIITVDPCNVTKMPSVKFLGPERQVEDFRTLLNDNLVDWNSDNDIFAQILKLLGIESFPQKPAICERDVFVLKENGECSICFSFRLNDNLPEIICKNQNCANCYHTECLYEWLISVNARRFFTEVIGQCPNCEKTISCTIAK